MSVCVCVCVCVRYIGHVPNEMNDCLRNLDGVDDSLFDQAFGSI